MMPRLLSNISFQLLCLLILAGCGSTYQVYKENISLLFPSAVSAPVDWQSVSASRFDVIAVETGGNAGTMALAFLEHGEHKFIGADNSFLVFRNGRIIRTSGFKNNLKFFGMTAADPLSQPASNKVQQWQYVMQNDSGASTMHSASWTNASLVRLGVLDLYIDTLMWTEDVVYEGTQTFRNQHWFTTDGSMLLKTVQHLPGHVPIEIVFLSRINRLRAQ